MPTTHISSSSTHHPYALADWDQGMVTSSIHQGMTAAPALHSPHIGDIFL